MSLPNEILQAVFSCLSINAKISMKLLCVSAYHKILALSPPRPKLLGLSTLVTMDEPNEHITIGLVDPTQVTATGYSDGPMNRFSFGIFFRFKPTMESQNVIQVDISHIQPAKLEEKKFAKFIADFSDDKLKKYCGRSVSWYAYTQNPFGVTLSEPYQKMIREIIYTRYRYCFNAEAPIRMIDDKFKKIGDVNIGDLLMSENGEPTTVKLIKKTVYNTVQNMVQLEDFQITLGHPIFINGEWYRPDEIYPVTPIYVTTLFNFYCEPHHYLVVGQKKQYTVSSLGGYCQRITINDPYSDILFGSGYGTEKAKRYEWLLSLPHRIPNEIVEAETNKYWTRSVK